ncbi:lipopolysaccharide biosynthesis protein [Arcticibacter sp.]|uniref:lipopolysaccharide biosynthesis protein n=1 Tax=Arcticibacter sp. TaxID=1872630 RepID=UPI00388DE479
MSFRETAIAGIGWSFIQQFGAKLVSLVIGIVLARLLGPEEFGLVAMVYVFIAVGSSLMDSGLTSSLIRSAEVDQSDYSTVFLFNLAGSVVVYAMLFFVAPLIASFYKQDILVDIIRVTGISFIINASYGVHNTRFIKMMNFKIQAFMQIPAIVGSGILGIVIAKAGFGVWSLVWMSLFSSFLLALMHWMFSDWRPEFIFDKNSFKRHFNFGYKMTLSGLLETLYQNIYVIIIGKYYSATQLGFYSRADSMSQFPVSNLAAAMNKVTYPMFASISDDNHRLKMVYKRILKQVVFWNAPMLIILILIAEPLFRILLTERWLPAVPYFRILCAAGIMYPLHSFNLNILKVKGRSDLFLKLEVIKKVSSVIGIICVIPLGIYGLLFFQLGYSFIGYYINSIYSGKIIGYPVKEQIIDLLPSISLSILTGFICVFGDRYLVSDLMANDLVRITLVSTIYIIIYLFSANATKLSAISDFRQLILKL